MTNFKAMDLSQFSGIQAQLDNDADVLLLLVLDMSQQSIFKKTLKQIMQSNQIMHLE